MVMNWIAPAELAGLVSRLPLDGLASRCLSQLQTLDSPILVTGQHAASFSRTLATKYFDACLEGLSLTGMNQIVNQLDSLGENVVQALLVDGERYQYIVLLSSQLDAVIALAEIEFPAE